MYKQLSPVIRWGDIYRLWDPFKVSNLLFCVCVLVLFYYCAWVRVGASDMHCQGWNILSFLWVRLTHFPSCSAQSGCVDVRVARQVPSCGVCLQPQQVGLLRLLFYHFLIAMDRAILSGRLQIGFPQDFFCHDSIFKCFLPYCSDHWSNLVPRLQLQGLLPVS